MEAGVTKATKRLHRSGLAGLAALATVGGALVVTAGSAGATSTATVTRIAGADRYATAAALADKTFTTSTNAIIASGAAAHFADALAGNYLAGQLKAPVLLTASTGSIPKATTDELTKLGVKTVYVLGDANAVPTAQSDALTAAGYTVTRLGGADRYATAKLVAEQSGLTAAGSIAGVKTAIVATGQNFPDALSAGPIAYAKNLPIILTTPASLSTTASATLTDLGIKNVIIAGSTAAVSQADEDAIKALGITTTRESGTDRSNTSQLLAEWAISNAGFTATSFSVASGDSSLGGADALAGGPFAGSTSTPILVTNTITDAGSVTKFATAHSGATTSVSVFGLAASVSDAAVTAITTAVQGGAANQSLTVSPSTKVANTISTATTNTGARTYTVTGLDNTKTYSILLAPAANVAVSSTGNVTFLNSGAPTAGNAGISIETVNGAPGTLAAGGAGVTQVNGVAPSAGSITFSVDAVVTGAVVPVVFSDTNGDGNLNFATAPTATVGQAPTEPFGIGGEVDWNPAQAASGIVAANDTIKSANTTTKLIVGTNATYTYDANDLFYVDSTLNPGVKDASEQVTMANFEKVLTATGGDIIEGNAAGTATVYQQDPTLQSTFLLENTSPVAPGALTVPAATLADTNAIVTVPSAGLVSGATITTYIAAGAGAFSAATANSSATTDADSTTAGFQIKVTGLTASTAYTVYATQTVAGEASQPSAGTAFTTTATPPATDTALKISSVTVNDVNDGTGSTSTVIVTFNKTVTAVTAAGLNVSPTSQPTLLDASTAGVIGADGVTVTYTLTTALNDATTDVAYTATVAAGGATTADGVSGKISNTFSY